MSYIKLNPKTDKELVEMALHLGDVKMLYNACVDIMRQEPDMIGYEKIAKALAYIVWKQEEQRRRPYIQCVELEESLNENQRNLLDYIMMEFLTAPESDSMTVNKLHSLLTLIVSKSDMIDYYASLDSGHTIICKKFCNNFRQEILDIVN